MAEKEKLKKEFLKAVPNARTINPFMMSIFEFMYQAHLSAKKGTRLLNIYMSSDASGKREDVYRNHFFNECEYKVIDFNQHHFIYHGKKEDEPYTLPFSDNHFDVVVTTKYIMEHVAEPEQAIREFRRVVKPGGEVFLVAAHVRRQHQAPYDFFRYTEFGLEYLFKKVGFREWTITPTDGAMYTIPYYSYFFQRQTPMPKWLEFFMNSIHTWIIEPVGFFIQRFDTGYGRDLTSYFCARAKK